MTNNTQAKRDDSDTQISGMGQTASPRWEKFTVCVIALAFLALTLAFSLGPISESPDEFSHYTYTRYLIHNHQLPDPVTRPFIQAHQAPLYYVIGIPILLAVDSDRVIPPIKNPWGGYKIDAVGNDNKNVRLHTLAERFPYASSPIALAIHITRLLSVALGLGTVLTCYFIFRLLWPGSPALRLAALGFVAFWPQFIWLSSVINNDNLLNLMSAVTLLVLLRYQRSGLTTQGSIVLGTVFGLALISKASAVFLALPIGVMLLLDWKRWRFAVLAMAIAAALGAWWYVRNMLTIHTLSGWPAGPQYGGLRPDQSLLVVAWERMPFVYQGLWARFGQVDVSVNPPIYRFFDILLLVGLAGQTLWLVRSARAFDRARWNAPNNRAFFITGAFALCWLIGVYYSAGVVSQGNQGRYLQPGLAAWAAILAVGIITLIPRQIQLRVALSTTSFMALAAMLCLFGYFFPAYRPLPLPDHIDKPLDFTYGESARLIGMSPAQVHARPGDTIEISLYWQAIGPTRKNLAVFLHTVGSDVVKRDSFPGTGNLPSPDWRPGQTWEERYVITIPRRSEPQHVYDLVAGLYDVDTGTALGAIDSTGKESQPLIGRIAVNGSTLPFDLAYNFGGVIGLEQPKISRQADRVETCLGWQSIKPTPYDYQMFIHILRADGTIVAQSDFQPMAGNYPTDAWSPGEVVKMCIPLDAPGLPENGWHVSIGLYDLATGERLSVTDGTGTLQPDDVVTVSP